MNLDVFNHTMKRKAQYAWAVSARTLNVPWLSLSLKKVTTGNTHVIILMYHRVINDKIMLGVASSSTISVKEATFEKHMQYLSRNYHVLPLRDYAQIRELNRKLKPRTAVITFDDGWQDNYTTAFPILQKYNLPATVFLTTDYIGTNRILWPEHIRFLMRYMHERAEGVGMILSKLDEYPAELKHRVTAHGIRLSIFQTIDYLKYQDEALRERFIGLLEEELGHPEFPHAANAFLTWEQVKEMSENGIDFGSHGKSHRILTGLPDEEILKELSESRTKIETETGKSCNLFAYPNGDYNPSILGKLPQAGYALAATTEPGLNTMNTDFYRLKRVNVCESRFASPKGRFSKSFFSTSLARMMVERY